MRAFIAIDIDEDVKKEIQRLQYKCDGIRWLRSDQIHLTLNFLGELSEETVQNLISKLKKIEIHNFIISLDSCGFFPSPKRPSVFWIGVILNPFLMALKKNIDESVLSCSIELENRPFKPHITIARISKITEHDITKIAKRAKNFSAKFTVNTFSLYSSELKTDGAVYNLLERFPLITNIQ